jgi:DNA-binding GntR family transcriptional regulator
MSVSRAAMPIRVDRTSPVPLYFQVAQHLEQMIESGELPMGTRLDNETDLAGQLGLSKPTMRRAIEYLVGRGLLVRRRGIGTQVVQAKVTREIELTSLYDDLAKTGRDPSTRVVSFGTEPASDSLAATLGIPAGTPVYVFERLRYAGAEPLALMRNHVPEQLIRLSAADLQTQGLYNLFRANGISLWIAKQAIGARAATAAEARALGEKKGAPLLTMERSAYDEQGRAVEHGRHIYRASRYRFDLTLTGW